MGLLVGNVKLYCMRLCFAGGCWWAHV